jgi:Tol biopolymer transport system component
MHVRLLTLPILVTAVLSACGDGSGPVDPPPAQPTQGALTIRVETTGSLPDPNGYQLVGAGPTVSIPVDGSVRVDSLNAASYTVTLEKASVYCEVENGRTRTASVLGGGNTEVVFKVRCEGDGVAFILQRPNQMGLLLIAFPGRAPDTLATGLTMSRIRFSPDRRRIAFSRGESGGGPFSIAMVDLDSRTVSPVTPGPGNFTREHPAWSPDGTHMAYAAGHELRVIRIGEAGETTILQEPYQNGGFLTLPVWSPDGTRIAFVKQGPGHTYYVMMMNRDGTGGWVLHQMEHMPPQILDIDWSPDGSSIVYTERYRGIYTVNVATGAKLLVVPPPTSPLLEFTNPTYLRDGRIGFYIPPAVGGDSWQGNWVVNADGTGMTRVTLTGPAGARMTSWQ